MALPTLKAFIDRSADITFSRSSYVQEPGFEELYIHVGTQFIGGEIRSRTIVLSRVTATKPGAGAFTVLIQGLHKKLHIGVECVLNERLVKKLGRMGFTRAPGEGAPSFYLLVDEELKNDKVHRRASAVG